MGKTGRSIRVGWMREGNDNSICAEQRPRESERVGNERDEYGKRGVEDQEGPVAVRGWEEERKWRLR